MRTGNFIFATVVLAFCVASPAFAQHPPVHPVPEPSDIGLFLMGVVGLMIGRRSSRRRNRSDDDTKA